MSAFPCPIAGCRATDTDVIDTRVRPHKVWRRRKCSNGHRFNTFELHHDGDDRYTHPVPLVPTMAH